MIGCRTVNRIVLIVAVALTTLGTDALFSQGRPTAPNRRTVVLDGREVVEGEVIVRYRSQIDRIHVERAEFQVDLDTSEALGRGGWRRMRSRNLTTREMIAALRANPDVEFVEPNYIIRAQALPNDPSMSALWGLSNTGQTVDGNPGTPGADIDADGAWNRTTGSRANIVAIIDTGIDYTHPDLAANVFSAPTAFSVTVGSTTINCAAGTHGFNAVTDTCDPFDDNGHGTHVSGIIGAVGNNNLGVTGVNWTASLMALKVLGADGTGTTSDAIKGIDFVIKAKQALGAQANVRVLNASWSGEGTSVALDQEIAAANNAGMLFVASAGSEGGDDDAVPRYPASSTNANVITVAAVDNDDVLAPFSNYGATSVDLAAPGAAILSTYVNNSYRNQTGTSMAAPFVAGTAALVLASCPGYNTAQLKSALMNTVDPLPSLSGKSVSGGRLNANAAVHSCGQPAVTVNGATTNITVAGGSTITVNVSNGPGNVSDWVMMVPAGAAPDTWGPDYKYLSGTRTRPAAGMTSATVQFTAPASGAWEFRFYHNDAFTLLATSPTVTVGSGSNPPPTLSSIAPTSQTAGSGAFNLTVTGSGFVNGSVVRVNGASRTTTFMSSTSLIAAIPASDVSSAGTLAVTVFTPTPGGGTSNSVNFTVTAPTSTAPRVTVNGSSSPITVAGGSTISVNVSNGPGNVSDWVMMVAAGAAPDTWGPDYKYLSGTRTRPATGMTSATLQFTAPASGAWEFRFYHNDAFTLLATSPTVTVGSGSNPAPTLSSIAPTSQTAGSAAFTLTVTGSGFVNGSVVRVNGSSRTTTFVSSTSLTAAIPASDVASAGTLAITVFTPTPGGGTSGTVNLTVSPASSTGPTLRVNGSSSPITVAGGSTITVNVSNGPGNVSDWVMMVPAGAAPNTWGPDYKYLSGTRTRPATGMTSATITFTAPAGGGDFEFRFYQNDNFTLLATSPVVTVTASSSSTSPSLAVNGSSAPITVAAGSTISVTVSNGPGNISDWVMIVPAGAPAETWGPDYKYLSGSRTRPASGMTSATISFTAPAGGGNFELRFYQNDTFTLLATSPRVTVTP